MDTKFSTAIHLLILVSESRVPMSSEQIAQSVGTNASYIRKARRCCALEASAQSDFAEEALRSLVIYGFRSTFSCNHLRVRLEAIRAERSRRPLPHLGRLTVRIAILFRENAFARLQITRPMIQVEGKLMNFEDAQAKALAFRDDRDWSQYHNPKDLAISICLEAAELLECFQWSGKNLEGRASRDHMSEELADVVVYCIYLADALDVEIADIVNAKINLDEIKYPIEKSRGNSKKYTELDS